MSFKTEPFKDFAQDWAILTAGEKSNFNSMTIGWGGMGTLWQKSVVTVYVKPIRYTHEFMEKYDYFSVSFYSKEFRKALGIMGSTSGRDTDKVKASGLTPVYANNTVSYKEAKTTIYLKKIYSQEMNEKTMPQEVIDTYYETEAPHTIFIGEVVEIVEK